MKKQFIIFVVALLCCSFALAELEVGNNSVNSKYARGGFLKGWVELNFTNHPLASEFTDNIGNAVDLQEVLDESSFPYNCTTNKCQDTFDATNPENSKQVTINKDESEVLGLKIVGDLEEIRSISFNITSNAAESVENQLKIDILSDGIIDAGNTQSSQNTDPTVNGGCYSEEASESEAILDPIQYCQRMTLGEAPGFKIGAWVKEDVAGEANITMSLYDFNYNFINECDLDKGDITSLGAIAYCDVDHLVTEEDDYYICVRLGQGAGEYSTMVSQSTDVDDKCGFVGDPDPSRQEIAAYKIYSKSKLFGSIGTIEISDTLPSGESLAVMAEEYIYDRYGEAGCSMGCVIPIRFNSFEDQVLTIDNILMDYSTTAAVSKERSFYDVEVIGAIINSGLAKLTLDGFFTMPTALGKIDYELHLGEEEIILKNLEIEDIRGVLYPTQTAVLFPTEFILGISSSVDLDYSWDFGDESGSKSTTTNSIMYTYSEKGNYTLTVTMTDLSGNEFSQDFEIIVDSPEQLIKTRLDELDEQVKKLETEIGGIDAFGQSVLKEEISLEEIKSLVAELKTKSQTQQTNESTMEIIKDILSIQLPDSVLQTSTQRIPFFSRKENINLDSIVEITNDYVEEGSESQIENAILFWSQSNVNMLISTKDIIVKTGTETESVVKVFDLKLAPKEYFEEEYYLVFNSVSGLQIDVSNDSIIETESGAKAVLIDPQSEESIRFSMPDADVKNLPVYLTPRISALSIEDTEIQELPDEKSKKITLMILIFLALIIIGFVSYIVLQKWYKIKYEKYLFKDRNNLYNVMIYVNNMKKQKVSNEDIKKSLRKSGWSGEQIRYIMRKYEGRRTGMAEIGGHKTKSPKKNTSPNESQQKRATPEKNPVSFSTQNNQNRPGGKRGLSGAN